MCHGSSQAHILVSLGSVHVVTSCCPSVVPGHFAPAYGPPATMARVDVDETVELLGPARADSAPPRLGVTRADEVQVAAVRSGLRTVQMNALAPVVLLVSDPPDRAAQPQVCNTVVALEQHRHCGKHSTGKTAPEHGGALHADVRVQLRSTGERAALGASMPTHTRSVQPSGTASVGSHVSCYSHHRRCMSERSARA